jgi:HK97 family phage portal protein
MAGKIQIGNFSMSWGKAYGPGEGYTYDLKGTSALQAHAIFGTDNFSDEPVSVRRSLGLAPVWTCLNVRSRTVSSLPIAPHIEENGTKRVLTDHALYYPLAQQANSWLSSANMFLTSMLHSDGHGDSVIGINRDSRGRPNAFDPICPGDWDVTKRNGELWYLINGEMYPSREVLHFRWFSMDGYRGISPIMQNQITMGKAFKQNRYSTYALGDRPPGHLSYEGQLSAEQRAQNQKSWKEDRTAGRVPLLTGKWTYQPHIIPPGDAEYIETAQLTEQQIYGIYQLPPAFAQNYDRMTWSNAEQADLVYAKHTITPICRVMEQEMNMKLFTEKEKKTMYVKFNLNGLLRGDSKARAEFYTAMRNIGFMNANEGRSLEDMNAYPGGEIYTVQAANIPVDQLKQFYTQKVVPTVPKTESNGKAKVNGYHYEEA